MAVGIPGTGLGGVFYFCMAAAMPVRQLMYSVAGRREGSWRSVGVHLALLAGILTVMWVEALVIKWIMVLVGHWAPQGSGVHAMVDSAAQQMSPALALLPFIMLGGLLGGLELLRMEVNWWERCRAAKRAPVLAPAPVVA